jgi:hypothetical protein
MQLSLGTGLGLGRLRRPAPAEPGVPALVRPPALIGDGRIGAPLTVDPGDWTGAARLAVAWLRNGAPIAGAEAPGYVPGAADDRAALAARVTAFGATGRIAAETPAITIVFPQPLLVGPLPDLDYTQGTGPHIVDISPFFSGSSLEFSVSGDGVAVDSATGLLTVDVAALLSGVTVLVTATNSGGAAASRFRLTVTSAPVAIPPVLTAAPALVGGGRVGEAIAVDPGLWAGEPAPELALQWLAGGAPIAGATEPSFVPGAAEDGAAVSCRIVAANAAGTAEAETERRVVTQVPPAAVGDFADVALALGGEGLTLAAAAAFAGAALRFTAAGAEAEVDPTTGVLTIPAATRRAAETVTVVATNSGGAASLGFAVTVLAAPTALAAPSAVVLTQGQGSRTVAVADFFAGDDLGYVLDAAPDGVTIDAGSGLVTVPTAAPLEATVTVRAENAVGTATQAFALRVAAAAMAPVAIGSPEAAVFAQGPGTRTVSAQAFFAGDDLVYVLDAAPAGVTIDAGSGLVTVPTAAALEATVVVRASNAAGGATQSFAVSVIATVTVFDAAAKLAAVDFLHRTLAPTWTWDAAQSCAVLTPGHPSDFTHGAWTLGRGDGLYRALARIRHSGTAFARSRPFGLNGRMARDAAGNWRGIRVELDRRVDGTTAFEIREYAGRGEAMPLLGGGAAAWSYAVWSWLEVEFDGATVRGRVYAETAAAPAWQATATTGHLGAGFFGPMSHTFAGGIYPIIDIRRLEYHPAAATAPAAPAGEHWTLEQITVQP